jgi:hypothetical protein
MRTASALKLGANVRFWRKADIGLIGVEWPLLTQSGHWHHAV